MGVCCIGGALGTGDTQVLDSINGVQVSHSRATDVSHVEYQSFIVFNAIYRPLASRRQVMLEHCTL